MKKITVLAFAFCSIFLFSTCSDGDQDISPLNLEDNFSQALPTDQTLIRYINQFAKLSKASLRKNVDLNQLQIDLNNISSEQDFNNKIDLYFENAAEVKTIIYDSRAIYEKFWKLNADLKRIPQDRQETIIKNSVKEIVERGYSLSINKSNSNSGKKDPCTIQFESDNQSCAEGSYVAAAGCGLLTPTLLGALACGAVVVAADVVCHRAASRTLDNCQAVS